MPAEADMVTVFRSADEDAEDDAKAITELLNAEGIEAVLLDDTAPGVPSGAWEVRVASGDSDRAEQLISEARLPDQDLTDVDESSDLDVETVFHSHSGTLAEFEALSIKSMLESAGIAAIVVGDSVLPNLGFDVQVAKEHAERARQLIAEAEASGSQAAESEERATETPLNP